ncbi:DNA-directed RNA polymerase I core subunit rpa12 [Rhizoclosmatium sp. JEL0117]|nr:DNA-directed RNA polymerase I core subunit rpa12 [Rhizoclosmatium sp. JEL0117]
MAPKPKGQTQKHSLIFCPDCGSLLDPPESLETNVQCRLCACIIRSEGKPTVFNLSSTPWGLIYTHLVPDFDAVEVITQSNASAFPERPSVNKKKEGEEEDTIAHLRDGATIKEKCPKCDAPEMVFHTAQLRSADEGQTIFYSCVKCGFKEKLHS